MDVNKNSTSLQDRIKALNLNQTIQLTPEKNADFSAKNGLKHSENSSNLDKRLSKEISSLTAKKLSKEITTADLGQSTAPSSDEFDDKNEVDISTYSTIVSNTPTRMRSKFECSSEYSHYSDIPSNIPATFDKDLLKETMDPPIKRNSTFDHENTLEIESEETDVYASPINLPVDVANEKPPEPDEIKLKIGNIRKTIRDPRMRKMVDMSDLLTRSESNIAENSSQSKFFTNNPDYNDAVNSPTFFKRSQSLGDAISVADEQIYKRPSLPVLNEQSNISKFTYNTDSPSLRLSSGSTASREPSITSVHSTESRRSANMSELSDDDRRSRNYSDVSVIHEADNYVSFKSLYDDVNDDFVVVKADTAVAGKLTLTNETDASSSTLTAAISPASPSTEENSPSGTPVTKTPKKKPRNVFGKISKAMKEKISSPKLSTSAKSPKLTGSAGTSPNHQFQKSPKMTPRREASSPALASQTQHEPLKHRALTIDKMMSPGKTSWYVNPPSTQGRPKSLFTDATPSDEGVYYDPSMDNNGKSEFGDILTIEVIQEEDDEGIYNDGDLYQGSALTLEKRSQSLASLNHDFMEQAERNRRLSDNIGAWRQTAAGFESDGLYMTSSTPPIPPPKYKSMRRKNERKMAESDTMTSPNPDTSSKSTWVKLRNKSPDLNNEERQNWPSKRPPSMPLDMPPSPPPATSSASANDSPISDKPTRDENEYVSATVDSNSPPSTRRDGSPVLQKAKPPPIPSKDLYFAKQENKNKLTTPESDEDEDTIYHTVGDPDIKSSDNTVNGLQNIITPLPRANISKLEQLDRKNGLQNGSLQQEKRFLEKPPALLPKKPIAKPKPPEIPKAQKKPYNYTQVTPKTKGNNKPDIPSRPKISDNMDMKNKPNFTRVISAPEISQKPTLNKLQAQNTSNSKPELPTKPNGADEKSKFNMVNPPAMNQSTSSEVDDLDTVRPPPRPLRNKKLQEIAQKDNTKFDEQPPSPKVPQRSAAIAELGKLISMGGPLSPQHMKSSQQKITNRSAEPKPTSQISEQAVKNLQKNEENKVDSSSPVASNTPASNPTVLLLTAATNTQSVRQSPSVPISPKAPSPTKPRQRRPEAKRPTTAPPPRPTGPPPPRPDQVSPTENNKTSIRKAGKPGPPRRPPPPSSEKIKAAEERRKMKSVTTQEEIEEDEYHDGLLKHEEDNTYADIDDRAFDFARAKDRSFQKDTTPVPPARTKHTMKLAVNTMNAISAMKKNFGRRKSNDNILSEKAAVPSYGIYNDGEEEAVYAGID